MSILDSFKSQLEQDLNCLIENHKKEMESEKERMKIERDALTAQFEDELRELRLKHQKELIEAEETQKKKLESIREVLKLEANALSNMNNNNEQSTTNDDAETNNDNSNNINNDEKEDNLNSDDPIDQEIIKKFDELNEIEKQMTDLPQSSRDPQDFQKLLLINKKQYNLLKDIANFMKKKVYENTHKLNLQLISINNAYRDQFRQYDWFYKKQKEIQEIKP